MEPARREIEVKFRVADPADLRRRIEGFGAKFHGRVHETNGMFDTPDGQLRSADCGLRIRESQPLDEVTRSAALLTYKGRRAAGPLKSREEIETRIENAADMRLVLQRLGFRETLIYEKRRETWKLDRFSITLDELPDGTWWSEIEGPESGLEALAGKLGFEMSQKAMQDYVAYTVANAKRRDDGVIELRF